MESTPVPVNSGRTRMSSHHEWSYPLDRPQASDLPQRQRIDHDGPHSQGTSTVNGEVVPRRSKMANRTQFIRDLVKATPNCLRQRRTLYDRVQVLLVYWSHGQYQEMQRNAEAIGQMFKDSYQFEIEKVPLSNDKAPINLNRKLYAAMDDLSEASKQNLIIIFYCGHGVSDTDGRLLWKPERDTSVELEWHKEQDSLLHADCDLLFLFDCCQASAMIKYGMNWMRRCELLSATSATEEALADEDFSFTAALIRFLGSDVCREKGISVDELGWDLKNPENLTEKHRLLKVPDYTYHSDHDKLLSSIFLNPLTQAPQTSPQVVSRTVEQLNVRIKKVMLMAVMLEESAVPSSVKEWSKMISVAPHEVVDIEYAEISPQEYSEVLACVETYAAFEGSLVVIVSMPVWLWDHLEHNDSYRPMGLVHPGNLLQSLKKSSEAVVSVIPEPTSKVKFEEQKAILKVEEEQKSHLQVPGRKNANDRFDEHLDWMPISFQNLGAIRDPTRPFHPAQDITIPSILPPTLKLSTRRSQSNVSSHGHRFHRSRLF